MLAESSTKKFMLTETLSFRHGFAVPLLAAARSPRGSDMPPACHSLPRGRFATLTEGGFEAAHEPPATCRSCRQRADVGIGPYAPRGSACTRRAEGSPPRAMRNQKLRSLEAISLRQRASKSSGVIAPRSTPPRVRTETVPFSMSRSPMTSIYGIFCSCASRIL